MKIGLILECQRGGPDEKVLTHLISRLRPEAQVITQPLGNKPALLRECGKVAADLFRIERCNGVLAVWDLWPSWRDTAPCLHQDREMALASLRAAGLTDRQVGLVCIIEELEGWLICDGRAVTARINQLRGGRGGLRVRISDQPCDRADPKTALRRMFKSEGEVRPYDDWMDAGRIAEALPNFRELDKCDTFLRFKTKVLACG